MLQTKRKNNMLIVTANGQLHDDEVNLPAVGVLFDGNWKLPVARSHWERMMRDWKELINQREQGVSGS
jgi:hypothetical protein